MNKQAVKWVAGMVLACGAMVCAQGAGAAPAQTPAQTPATQAAPAGEKPAPTGAYKVATVNIQYAIQACAEGKKAADDIQKRFTPKREELDRKQKEIQDLQLKLQQGEKVLNDEQKSQLIRDIDRKTKDFNRDNEDATNDYQQAVDTAFNAIGQKMLQVIAVYAQKNAYDLVLNSSNPGEVLWENSGKVNISDEVVGAYNLTFGAGGTGLSAPPAAPGAKPPATKPATPPATPPVKKP